MNSYVGVGPAGLALLALAPAIVTFFVFYHRRFLGVRRGWLFALGALIAAGGVVVLRLRDLQVLRIRGTGAEWHHGKDRPEVILAVACSGLLVVFAVPLIVRLHSKWVGRNLTDDEKLPTVQGVRAWLGGGNVALALLVSLCAWLGHGYSLWGVLALCTGLVLAYPVFNILASGAEPAPAAAPPDLSSERQRVLRLLEEGKIAADEGAELLSALGQSAAPPPDAAAGHAMATGRKMALVGAGVVLVSFFLPWFSVNVGQEMARLPNTFQFEATAPDWVSSPRLPTPRLRVTTGTVHVSGADVRYGLGWTALIAAVGVAVLPYVATSAKRRTQQVISFVALGLGGVILLYLLIQGMRYVSIGLIGAIGGYVLELVGIGTGRRAPQHTAET